MGGPAVRVAPWVRLRPAVASERDSSKVPGGGGPGGTGGNLRGSTLLGVPGGFWGPGGGGPLDDRKSWKYRFFRKSCNSGVSGRGVHISGKYESLCDGRRWCCEDRWDHRWDEMMNNFYKVMIIGVTFIKLRG